MYQRSGPEVLFGHLFGQDEGNLVTFSARQARLQRGDARANELANIAQRSWVYPAQSAAASEYLLAESESQRDAYFGVHLFRGPGNRRASNAVPLVRALWLDEDEGQYPANGPEPTAVIYSSASRRHLYWRLTRPVTIEWVAEMNRRIAAWAGGDIGKAGPASVLRPPGTRNFKRYPQVDEVRMEFSSEAWEPEVMEQAIPPLPTPGGQNYDGPYRGPEIELADYMRSVEVLFEAPDDKGIKYAIVCPWAAEHTGGDRTGTYLGQRADGAAWFHCYHDACHGRGWPAFKQVVPRVRRVRVNHPGFTGRITMEIHS